MTGLVPESHHRDRMTATVIRDANRIYRLFRLRNPNWNGKVSLVGESSIVFALHSLVIPWTLIDNRTAYQRIPLGPLLPATSFRNNPPLSPTSTTSVQTSKRAMTISCSTYRLSSF